MDINTAPLTTVEREKNQQYIQIAPINTVKVELVYLISAYTRSIIKPLNNKFDRVNNILQLENGLKQVRKN